MKKLKPLIFGSFLASMAISIFLIYSFDVDPVDESAYTAIIMSRAELEKSIEFQEAQPIKQIGKIYKKDSWVFITEKYKGIHIIDNTNPISPVKTGFIRVPGCIDISMKNNSLYADNSVDLVTIDMSTLPQIRITGRIRNVFPEPIPPDLKYIPNKFLNNRPPNTVIVEWKKIR